MVFIFKKLFNLPQEKIDNIMIVLIGLIALIGIIYTLPGAFDYWYYEQYELPVQELKNMEGLK